MISGTAWAIIGALALAVSALAGFVAKLYADCSSLRLDLKLCQGAQIAQAEQHHREVLTLLATVQRKRG